MRSAFVGAALAVAVGLAPAQGAPSGSDIITAISLSDLADLLSANSLPARVEAVGDNLMVVADLKALEVEADIHIGGISCGSDLYAANATTPCQVLEFVAILEIPQGVSDAAIAAVDRKFELSSIERVDATHVAVSDGVILMGGVAAENISANIGFFAGQCLAAVKELAKAAGRSS